MKLYYKTLISCTALLLLVACGGGSSTAPDANADGRTLTGTAAAGAPIVGIVNVKGAGGVTASSSIELDGTFSLDVADLTAPYILYAEGSVKGKSIKIYSAALAEGTINITPVTDFILRNALAVLPETVYSAGNIAVITESALAVAASDAKTSLDPLLSALGVPSDVDLLTTPFMADNTGIDAVLDALDISYSGTTATVNNKLTGSSFTDDFAVSGIGAALPASDKAATLAVMSDADAINALWQTLRDLYVTRPTNIALTDWFGNVADDFLNEGADKATMLSDWQMGDGPEVGSALLARIIEPMDVSTTSYSRGYRVELLYTSATESDAFNTTMVYASDKWYWYGDRKWIELGVDAHAYMGVTATGAMTFATGFEFSMDDRVNYAGARGANSAVVVGPGLPAAGLIFEHGFPDPGFRIHGVSGAFYSIPSDTLVAMIPDNSEYTFRLCSEMAVDLVGGTSCSVLHTYTDTVMKPPVPVAE